MWRVCCTLDKALNRIPPSLCGRQVAGSKGLQTSGGIKKAYRQVVGSKRLTDKWWDQKVYRQVVGSKGLQTSGGIKRCTDKWWDQKVYTSWWPTLTEDLHTKDEFIKKKSYV